MSNGEVRVTLSTWHAYAAGQKASEIYREKLIGSRWFHPKTGGLYFIEGFSFDSERERWMIMYRPEQRDDDDNADFLFAHLPEDFFREGRFLQVTKGA